MVVFFVGITDAEDCRGELREKTDRIFWKISFLVLILLHRCDKINPLGGIAQLGEHLPCKQGVMGSNPIISIKKDDRKVVFFCVVELVMRNHILPCVAMLYPKSTSVRSIRQNPTSKAYVAPRSLPCACVSGIISSLIT